MKIVIKKCDEPEAWYANSIGDAYWVYRETRDSYYVNDSNYVLKEDADVLPEAPSEEMVWEVDTYREL